MNAWVGCRRFRASRTRRNPCVGGNCNALRRRSAWHFVEWRSARSQTCSAIDAIRGAGGVARQALRRGREPGHPGFTLREASHREREDVPWLKTSAVRVVRPANRTRASSVISRTSPARANSAGSSSKTVRTSDNRSIRTSAIRSIGRRPGQGRRLRPTTLTSRCFRLTSTHTFCNTSLSYIAKNPS
jgi:hypothetical protein